MEFPDDDFLVRQGRAKTATIELKARDPAAVQMLARDSTAFKWGSWAPSECGEAADDYYVGKFTRGDDSGDLVGCVHPVSGIIHVVFKSRDGEGGFATAGGPGGYGIFPFGQPTERFDGFAFLRHLPDDGSKPEEVVAEGSLCGSRTPAVQSQAAQAVCKLDRVVFADGTNAVVGVADSKRVVVKGRLYVLARVTSRVVPADLILLFPKEVPKANIEVVAEAKAGGLGCTPSALTTGKHAGKQYLLCTVDKSKSRVLVGVVIPKALNGKTFEVLLLLGKPKAPGQAREWIDKQTLALDLDVEVVQPKPVPLKPVAPQPAAAQDPIEGHWVGFVPKPVQLPKELNLQPLVLDPLVPDADVRITKARQGPSVREDLFATATSSKVDLYLNKPRSQKYANGAVSLLYEGSVFPGGGSGSSPAQLELIVPGQRAVAFPQVCLGVAEQAKAPILCGFVSYAGRGWRIVLKRISD